MDANSSVAVVIAIAAITTVKNVADGVLAWLGKRDQLRNDVEMTGLKMQLKACEKQHEESEKDREQIKEEIEVIKKEMAKHGPISGVNKIPKQPKPPPAG